MEVEETTNKVLEKTSNFAHFVMLLLPPGLRRHNGLSSFAQASTSLREDKENRRKRAFGVHRPHVHNADISGPGISRSPL